jgi:hypothetical protein
LNSWFGEEAGWGVRGLAAGDWSGRGVYWQSISKMLAICGRLCSAESSGLLVL